MKIDQLSEESSWFHSRVKCFPLYTLLLAINTTKIDVLSLGNYFGPENKMNFLLIPNILPLFRLPRPRNGDPANSALRQGSDQRDHDSLGPYSAQGRP